LTESMEIRDVTWHPGVLPSEGVAVTVRPRYRSAAIPATILPADIPSREGKPGARIHFAEPQARTAAGQACVVYDVNDDYCLGGGWFI
jgi:tRNA-uridine 2-sulfurtransferase